MSKSFARLFSSWFKSIFLNDKSYDINNQIQITMSGSFFALGAFTHGAYAFGTSKPERSKIVKKYKMVRNGFTEFMVIDEQGKHYNVNNSFWFWKWDSIEDWSNIKEGDELYFKYYGWRIPVLGLFPNIYMTDKAKFLDSMTHVQFIRFENEQEAKKNNKFTNIRILRF